MKHLKQVILQISVLQLISLFSANPLFAQVKLSSTSQVSLTSSGGAPTGSSDSASIGANGKIIAYSSSANDILVGDGNSKDDIFIKNLETGSVTIQSVDRSGSSANDAAVLPSITGLDATGQFALSFTSDANNLGLISDQNGFSDVFIRVPSLGITEPISITPLGATGNGDSSSPSIAYVAQGSTIRVAFHSEASDLVANDTNSVSDVFLAEISPPKNGGNVNPNDIIKIKRISVSKSGVQGDDISTGAQISADGNFVAFSSSASNLVSSPFLGSISQVYLYNVKTKAITLISKDSDGNPGSAGSINPTLSFTGRYVTYLTLASNIHGGAPSSSVAAVRYDTVTKKTLRVNETENKIPGNGSVGEVAMDPSGRLVTFSDDSTNFDNTNPFAFSNIYVKDMASKKLTKISVPFHGSGQANGHSLRASLAINGLNSLTGLVAYQSQATDLLPGNTSNGGGDIFLGKISFGAIPFSNKAPIEVPPDLKLKNRNLSVLMQTFKLAKKRATNVKTNLNWEIELTGRTKNTPKKQTLVAKRNRTTARKLKPGTYNVRYRVVSKTGSKTVSRSNFSPKVRLVVK